MPTESQNIEIRAARPADASGIASLCGQLGYPTTEKEAGQRLQAILDQGDDAVLVATLPEGDIVGWVHVHVCRLLVADPQVTLGGLVVDEGHRGNGIGRRLMERVEAWAHERGCGVVVLSSNVVRDEAHRFYEGLGYERTKTSYAFRRTL